ncbi:MAG: hypothetical protein KDB61_16270, partial [Planctomycetes bacterium]|nr:hypothetical protein [Planctomycetota bacterium]
MIRILGLLAIAALLLLGYFLPSVDDLRMGAFRSGSQLDAGLARLEGPEWRTWLGPGDRVRLGDGREGTIEEMQDGQIQLTGQTASVPTGEVQAWLDSSRSLAQVLTGPLATETIGKGDEELTRIRLG